MKPPADYVRASLSLAAQAGNPLTAVQAEALIGHEIDVSIGPVHTGNGVIVDVRIVDDGHRMRLTVERGGRSCSVCHRVFTEQDASVELTRADTFADEAARPYATWALVYRDVPYWSPVCRNWATCRRVQLDDPLQEPDDEVTDQAVGAAR